MATDLDEKAGNDLTAMGDDLSISEFFEAEDLLGDDILPDFHDEIFEGSMDENSRNLQEKRACREKSDSSEASRELGSPFNGSGRVNSKSPPRKRVKSPATLISSVPDPVQNVPKVPANAPNQYNTMMEKLALSMKRSEMSRAQIMRQRKQSMTSTSGVSVVPQSQTVSNLSRFLNGSQSTLTSGLDQSRRQLASYMTQMSYKTF
eukprot:CAMPEP_0183302808 /NCGR_PEP_ID=MMETSP0160_2-20130417/8463_1 /TAXON_ID=2839 ORGANISM="Odontella Sinensis, Strain Grunow 1884" /NCGR_SAMPLE_ID=MMETSP0160_2 /ASSEMBLY_ACC=CAM_ASM_000250 /LENGTH=204 /DNA_ID=CAMNT_0025465625 /DNA_START=94 /DNA_END=708 /DNA_ORIENTATION=+